MDEDKTKEEQTKSKDESSKESNILVTLIVFIFNNFTNILVIVLILLLFYYAYNQFNETEEESCVKQAPVMNDKVRDFDIREAIQELKIMQKRILNGISNIA
jgi:LPS O-antigen subunit length determinant protein (WzzB/FepE family)